LNSIDEALKDLEETMELNPKDLIANTDKNCLKSLTNAIEFNVSFCSEGAFYSHTKEQI